MWDVEIIKLFCCCLPEMEKEKKIISFFGFVRDDWIIKINLLTKATALMVSIAKGEKIALKTSVTKDDSVKWLSCLSKNYQVKFSLKIYSPKIWTRLIRYLNARCLRSRRHHRRTERIIRSTNHSPIRFAYVPKI